MAQTVIPVAVDTKTLTAMTGLSRQRLDKLRKDVKSGFPKPSRIGRSVRYNVEEVMQWMEAMKSGNSALLQELVQKNHGQRAAQTVPAPCPLQRPAIKTRPTIAELNIANKKACSTTLAKGQHYVGSLIETADGPPAKYYRVVPQHAADLAALGSTHLIVRHQIYFAGGCTVKKTTSDVPLPGDNVSQVGIKELEPATSIDNAEVETPTPLGAPAIEALKLDYESGLSLDVLCSRYHIGKTRVSKMLRAAGAQLRKPGRSSIAGRADIGAVQGAAQ
jgi:predicted DNA-binding transcriptional regulator AlpA